MIEYRFATQDDVENMVKAIYDIWLNKENGSIEDAIEVSEGFAYYYRNFPDYTDHRVVLAIDTDTGVIAGIAGYLEHPLAEMPGVKAAQMNPVGVRKEYRRKGIAKKCSDFLCDYLKENGYAVVLVCGVPYLYPQIGFHSVFSFTKAEFEVPLNLEKTKEIVLEKANFENINTILKLYKTANKGNLFAIDRSEVWLERKFFFSKFQIKDFAPQLPLGTVDVNRVYFVKKDKVFVGYFLLNNADSNEVNMEELLVTEESLVGTVLNEVQKLFNTKKISVHHCSVGSSIYETAEKYGQIFNFESALFMRILDTEKLLRGMKCIFEKRLKEAISDVELEQISTLLDALTEEQKTSLFAGKNLYQEMAEKAGGTVNTADAIRMETLFPKHSPYLSEPDMN